MAIDPSHFAAAVQNHGLCCGQVFHALIMDDNARNAGKRRVQLEM